VLDPRLVRILGIETSSRRGSVALVEHGKIIAAREHSTPNAHGEHLLELVNQACADAGWRPSQIERLAVGIGPGSFTGLRVGIAFAQGIAIGLGLSLCGVGSLRAMAHAAHPTGDVVACPVLDARRSEVFVAAYGAGGQEILSPRALAPDAARAAFESLGRPYRLLGEAARLVGLSPIQYGPHLDLPHAASVAQVAEETAGSAESTAPLYIRPVDAIRPNLPPSPLSSSRD
jgi:tRNA threonylcarbamoyladenosine biosynthesis protein TsaB